MKRVLTSLILTFITTITIMSQNSIYDFTVKDNKGNDVSLAQYKGKVLLVVNTATACGFTPQYAELEALYEAYSDKGLEILDFPCNQFGAQAPGTDEEIQEFCVLNFNTRFPRFKKIEVNGENELPLYTYLKSQKGFAGFDPAHPLTNILHGMFSKVDADYAKKPDVKWNFTKFLIDQEGRVVSRFEPTATKEALAPAIEALLK
ncbi:MAG: glutathione peroxidase [Bacteroidales bacterium]|nr:glutathione peroxidase [Bacteroidales bacterium]